MYTRIFNLIIYFIVLFDSINNIGVDNMILFCITDAVYSARQDNADALDNSKKKLQSINNNIKYLEERQHDLEKDYATLL